MPDNFSITNNGILIDSNGIDPVTRWDGLLPTTETAGVPAPPTAPTISAAGSGSITGEYFAYIVWLDRFDNQSNPSPLGGPVNALNNGNINYTNLPVPTDPKVITMQIWRNTAGQTTTFYLDVETNDVTSGTAGSIMGDTVLATQLSQAQFDTNGNTLTFLYGIPPDWKPFNCQYLGRMYMAGEIIYSEGCVQMTFGNTLVYGNGTRWPANFAGRFLYVDNGTSGIQIASVNAITQTLELVSAYTGPTDQFVTYWIRPAPAEKNLLYYSGPGTPEGFPANNALDISEDGFEYTGLIVLSSFLYIMKQRRLYRLTAQADPAQDGFIFLDANRGCINQRCVVIIGDTAYLLDEQGIYSFQGGTCTDLSKPIQSIFRGNNKFYQLHWAASRFWHACFDENYEILRWFITLSGDYLPRHALCYNYDFKRWWIEEYPMPIGCNTIGRTPPNPGTWREGGQDILYYGSRARKVYEIGYGQTLDGPDPNAGTTRNTVTAIGICSLTCDMASFADSGIVGSNVYIISGAGEGQNRRISAATETVLTLTQPWTIMPNTTSVFLIGGIPWEWRSGRVQFSDNEARNTRKIVLGFRTQDLDSEAIAQLYVNYKKDPIVNNMRYSKAQRRGVSTVPKSPEQRIDLTREQGVADINIDAQRERNTDAPRRITVDFSGVAREETLSIKSVEMQGTMASQGGGDQG